MKNGFIGFWGIFIAYFIFVHPCIIYYNTYHTSNNTENGKLAIFYLGLSFLLWIIVLGTTLWLIFKNGILAKKNLVYIDGHGRRVQAMIIQSHILKEHKNFISRQITLEINNFSGEVIGHTMVVNDRRPKENRFETGKNIYLKVDAEFKKNPYLLLEGSTSKVNYALLLIWLAFTGGIVAYYQYSYSTESGGLGWRFLELFHPLLVIPACFILFTGVFYLIFRVFIMGNNTERELLELKFKGEKAMAEIVTVKQTGTYINEQPQVEYTLKFTDKYGQMIHAVKKEIVSLLDIGKVSALECREVMYLPDRPEKFVFYDQINN
jgi:hypothetical protein